MEAFELYMLKKFHNIKLNSLTNDMLSFWEKDFEQSIEKHKRFLQENSVIHEHDAFQYPVRNKFFWRKSLSKVRKNEE